MAESQEEVEIKIEIQKLLGQINDDMLKLKTELKSMNNLIEENASLPITMKMVNEKLMIAAKDVGIDIENLDDIESLQDLEDEDGARGGSDTVQSNSNASKQTSDASELSAAADKLTERIKHVLK